MRHFSRTRVRTWESRTMLSPATADGETVGDLADQAVRPVASRPGRTRSIFVRTAGKAGTTATNWCRTAFCPQSNVPRRNLRWTPFFRPFFSQYKLHLGRGGGGRRSERSRPPPPRPALRGPVGGGRQIRLCFDMPLSLPCNPFLPKNPGHFFLGRNLALCRHPARRQLKQIGSTARTCLPAYTTAGVW